MEISIIKEIEEFYNIKLIKIIEDDRQESSSVYYKNSNSYNVNEKGEITKLNLSDNNIDEISILSNLSDTLTHLNLSANRLINIKVLQNFKRLVLLDLNTNFISDIKPIAELVNIRQLYIDNNQISRVPKLIMPDLEELWLYSNKITSIRNLRNLKSLVSLNLSNNKISDISIIKEFVDLRYLGLGSNLISKIDVFRFFKSFETLNLSDNNISDLSALKNIEINTDLFLGQNQIIDLTPLYYTLKRNKIKFINVFENPILYPPKEIVQSGEYSIWQWFEMNIESAKEKIRYNLENKSTKLDLGKCGLTDLLLIPELFNCVHLEELILSNHYAKYNYENEYWDKVDKIGLSSNNLLNIPKEIKKLKNLKVLIIGGDWSKGDIWNRWRLKDISHVFYLKNLEVLNISNNEIEKIVNLSKLSKLKIFHANNNFIREIEPLGTFESLEEIYLSNNKLTDVDFLKDLRNIKTIDLHVNKIKDIRPIINIIKLIGISDSRWNIDTVSIHNNPLDDVLINILRQKNKDKKEEELKNYISRLLQGDSIVVKRIKLILLGNTRVGKTTLADILSGENKANGDSTHGINFFNFKVGEIQIKGYDFGGQDYYHNTHYSFFDEKSLYLLIWGNGQEDILSYNTNSEMLFPLNYWLGSLNKFAYRHSLIKFFEYIQNLSKLNSISISEIKELIGLINYSGINLTHEKKIKHFFNNLITELSISIEDYVDRFISKSSLNYKKLKKNIENFSEINFSDDLISKDFPFKTFVVQNFQDESSRKWLNEFELKNNYDFISDFKSFNFLKESSNAKDFIIKISTDFVKETKILNIDNNLEKAFEKEKIKVILNIEEVKNLENSIINYDDEKIDSLLNNLHSILACFYFKISDDIKEKLGNLDLENIVIVNVEKFTEWIYEILDQKTDDSNQKNSLKPKQRFNKEKGGYFSREDAEGWLTSKLAKSKIDYLLAFMLEHKLIFKMKNQELFFAPNHLKEGQSQTEKLFLKSFQPALVKYIFKEYFHTSILSEILNKYFDKLGLESENNKCKYVLWKNKLIFYEEENSEKLVYVSFEVVKSYSAISVSKFNDLVSDEFVLEICDFIEVTIKSYDFQKMILSPKKNYIPFDVIENGNIKENNQRVNFIVYENNIYRKSDFKMFLTNKEEYSMKKIFISYSKHDEDYKEELVDHLITLRDEGKIDDFNCNQIDLGENSLEVIQKQLEECDYMIALVSRKFLNTQYIREFEVQKAKDLGKKIIPIIIKPCDWETSIVSQFHASLRGRIISIDNDLFIKNTIKEVTEIERQGNWKFVINEFRKKILK